MTIPPDTGSAASDASDREVLGRALAAVESRRHAPDRRAVREAVAAEMDGKVKPLGSLGRLEELAIRVAGIRGEANPGRTNAAVVVAAADHGINAEAVSVYPAEVTGLMLQSFAAGGAAVSVLCARTGARLVVADLGVAVPPDCVGREVLDRRVRAGTGNSAVEPAMSHAEAVRALRYGIEIAESLIDEGVNLIGLGEMGIGNTTTASAMTSRLLGVEPQVVCGPGTGLDAERVWHKAQVVGRVLARHSHAIAPLDVLAAMGGLEVAGLTGVVLGCAARGVPVVLDGFITTAAALAAERMAPGAVDAMIAGHVSAEPGHAVQLRVLGLRPVLALDMRLGEGSGAAVAIGVIQSALDILADMATYASLGLGDQ